MRKAGDSLEAVLSRHPAVRECRVLARAHPQLGEIPVAEVVPADSEHAPLKSELIAHCRAELPTYKVPRELRFVAELERTITGKVKR